MNKNEIIRLIKNHYNFSQIYEFCPEGGLMNKNFSFKDESGQKYFLKIYQYYGENKIKESYNVKDLIAPEIKTNELIKSKDNKYLIEKDNVLIEISKFITNGKTIFLVQDINTKHLIEIAKNLALFHKKIENYQSNLKFIDFFTLDKDEEILNKINKKISGSNNFDIHCKKLIALKLRQINKFKNIEIKSNKLPRQLNHGDFLPPNCFFDKQDNFSHLIDFEHILYTYRIYDIVKTSLFLSRYEQYEIPNSGKYNLDKMTLFIKEYIKYNTLKKVELEHIPYLALFMSIKSDMVLYGYYIAKNRKVKNLLPEKNIEYYYTWWEKNYVKFEKKILEDLKY